MTNFRYQIAARLLAWLIVAVLAASAVFAVVASFLNPSEADAWLRIALAAASAAVAMIALSAGRAAARARALKEIHELLPVDDEAKALLLGPDRLESSGAPGKERDEQLIAAIAIRMDRASAIARHEGAIGALLERYWDWYLFLYLRYGLHLNRMRQEKRSALLQVLGKRAMQSGPRGGPQWKRLWLYNLHEMRPIVFAYAKRHLGIDVSHAAQQLDEADKAGPD